VSGIISERLLHKVESEDVVRQAFRRATRSISCPWLSGRYPGSQVLIRRLPMIAHSGTLANPHSLTVAGAAQA